jgi:hypothetical protein
MESIKLKAHIDQDGVLTVQMPHGITDLEAEVVVYFDAKSDTDDQEEWAIFVDRMYGALADDPIERPPEGPPDVRDEIE